MPNVNGKGPGRAPVARSPPARGSRSAQALRVPTGLYGIVGRVQVIERDIDGLMGRFLGRDRLVEVHPNQSPEQKMQSLGHELMHVILWDSGLHYLIPSKVEEALCDAFGSWFQGAVKSGFIKLKDNH